MRVHLSLLSVFDTCSCKQLNFLCERGPMDNRELERLNELAKTLVAGLNIVACVRHEPRSDVLSIRVWALTDPRSCTTKECIYGSKVSALEDREQFVRRGIDDFCSSNGPWRSIAADPRSRSTAEPR